MEKQIKEKIESVGVPLKDWDISINYGIKTGFNEAFIITGEKRAELIAQDSKSEEIIRPVLRGRDIKRYNYQFADLYIIATFPSKHYDIDNYPAIKDHLLSFGIKKLEQTGKEYKTNNIKIKSRKKTNNKWFETQDSISYWEDFYKQKIVYPDIMRMPRDEKLLNEYPYFYLDNNNFYAEATNFIMTGKDIDIVYLFLTSDLGFFAFSKFYTGPQFDETGFRYKKAYLDKTFIPKPTSQQISAIRNMIGALSKHETVDDQINTLWSEIIGLDAKEAKFVSEYKKSLLG